MAVPALLSVPGNTVPAVPVLVPAQFLGHPDKNPSQKCLVVEVRCGIQNYYASGYFTVERSSPELQGSIPVQIIYRKKNYRTWLLSR